MELWNDYEGKLLDGQFRLDRLIGPKGRSAFFTTSDKDGRPATIRVIESLNDEDEILARWNAVRAINEPSLVAILACNKTVLDGVHLVYAVLESTDASLSDLLRERALTPDETRQMASSVVTALEALHVKGLIHEHVEADSVLAKGEEVKLRGDCVREAPEGAEGETLRRRDAHDLAMLVGYALTQRRDVGQTRLPRPFDDFVRNGMSGTWGLKEMGGVARPVAVSSAPPVQAAGGAVKAPQPQMVSTPVKAAPLKVEDAPVTAAGPKAVPPLRAAAATPLRSAATSAQAVAASLSEAPQMPTRRPAREDRIVLEPEENVKSRSMFWAALAAAALLLVGLIWHFTHVNDSSAKTTVPVTAPALAPVPESSSAVTTPVTPATPMKPSAATASGRTAMVHSHVPVEQGAAPTGSQWRLVAYTFNREEQAQRKVEALAQVHPELKPEVFTPSGRAPYLVALGGWMSVDQASALKSRARSEGLPHDIYTQNYRAR